MQVSVPLQAGLLETIHAALQREDVFGWHSDSFGGLQVYSLVFWQFTIKEGSFDVKLSQEQTEGYGESKHHAYRCGMSNGCESEGVIPTEFLPVSTYYQASLEAGYFSVSVGFDFKDPFSWNGLCGG